MSTFLIANQLANLLRESGSSSPPTRRWLRLNPNAPEAAEGRGVVAVAGRVVEEVRAERAAAGLEGVVAAAEVAVGPGERAAVEKAVREGGLAGEERAEVAQVVERAAAG